MTIRWYRVEIRSGGEVLSCTPVEYVPDERGLGVYYVQAVDDSAAKAAAFDQYRRRQRNALKERRLRHARDGKCRCGGSKPDGQRYCGVCLQRDREAKERFAARQRGEKVTTPPKSESIRDTMERRAAERRLAVLIEVRDAFKIRTHEGFLKWLNARILELGGRR